MDASTATNAATNTSAAASDGQVEQDSHPAGLSYQEEGAAAVIADIKAQNKKHDERILPVWQSYLIFMLSWVFGGMIFAGLVGIRVLFDTERTTWLAQSAFGTFYWDLVIWNPMAAAMILNGGIIGFLFTVVELYRNDAAKGLAEKRKKQEEADYILKTTSAYLAMQEELRQDGTLAVNGSEQADSTLVESKKDK